MKIKVFTKIADINIINKWIILCLVLINIIVL